MNCHIFMTGILEVLYCVLIESPEVLNIIQENHIKSIISLLDKHGRNHKVREMFAEHVGKNLEQVLLYCISEQSSLISALFFPGLGCALLSVCV